MKQLPLAIAAAPEASFDNFVVGTNADLLAYLRGRAGTRDPALYLWGPSGCGKTHLLQALARDAGHANMTDRDAGAGAVFNARSGPPWAFDPSCRLVLIDDCDLLDAAQQQAAFALFIDAATHGVPVAAAGRLPPVDLPLRDDLRTRLGWGPVFAVAPLGEPQARAALKDEAGRRGIAFTDEVMDYLLSRFARDLKHQMALLDRLDDYALARKRAITLPLLREMLVEEGSAPCS